MLLNFTTLFLVYKWPLRIETAVIKLNEIEVFEVLFSKFCGLLREARDKSRLRNAKVFQGHIRNSFSSPTRVPCFIFQGPGFQVFLGSRFSVFKFFVRCHQGPTRVPGAGCPVCHLESVKIFQAYNLIIKIMARNFIIFQALLKAM